MAFILMEFKEPLNVHDKLMEFFDFDLNCTGQNGSYSLLDKTNEKEFDTDIEYWIDEVNDQEWKEIIQHVVREFCEEQTNKNLYTHALDYKTLVSDDAIIVSLIAMKG